MRLTYKNEKISGEHSVGVGQKTKSIGLADKAFYDFAIVQFVILCEIAMGVSINVLGL
jgi:hypothetical protein